MLLFTGLISHISSRFDTAGFFIRPEGKNIKPIWKLQF